MGAASLRHLRAATGLSQQALADLIHCSLDTISSVERDLFGVSNNIARKIFLATGALPMWLKLQDSLAPEALAWTREPYRPDHFQRWQEITKGDLLASISGGTDMGRFNAAMACLFEAARLQGKLGRFQAALTLEAFEIAFTDGFSDSARFTAYEKFIGEDFDFLASIGGRIEPKAK